MNENWDNNERIHEPIWDLPYTKLGIKNENFVQSKPKFDL